MKLKGLLSIYTLLTALLLVSCQKEDIPVSLPPKGEAEFGNVEMGEDYKDQIFFDFESGRVVHVSEINSWHLAFDAAIDGYHVFLNGGADVMIYNTGQTDFSKVTSAPAPTAKEWMFDRPSGLADSTAVGDWRSNGYLSKNEIFIVKLNATYNPNNLKKIRIVSVSSSEYVIEYADLNESYARIITIPKDDNYNYSYFSFDNDGYVLQPDPPKNSWDIVFTRYRFIYYDLDNFPYMVNGVLLNPYKTKAAKDSTNSFDALEGQAIIDLSYSNHRDVIGFDWKVYNFTTERYEIAKQYTYVINNRNGQYWKLRFLDFYNKQGIKGSPSFEFQREF